MVRKCRCPRTARRDPGPSKGKHVPVTQRRWAEVVVSRDAALMWEQTRGMNHIYFRRCTDNLH